MMEAVVLPSLNVCLRQEEFSDGSSDTTFTQYVSESMMEAVVLTSLQCVSETGRTQ